MQAMYLAGLPIPGPDVLELARPIEDEAERLETAYGNGVRILALRIPERESIVRALEEGRPTAALAEPRGPSPNMSAGFDGLVWRGSKMSEELPYTRSSLPDWRTRCTPWSQMSP